MRFRHLAWPLVLACAACGKTAKKPEPETPEVIYGRMRAAVLAADARTQWALFSSRYRAEAQKTLDEMKKLPEEQLAAAAKSVGTTADAVRAMKPEEALELALRAAQKDAAKMALYKDLGTPSAYRDGNRIRVIAKTVDLKWGYEVFFVEEDGQWKVDEEKEAEYGEETIGK